MPAKGYRKGRHDDKVPLPTLLRTRVSADLHSRLCGDARERRLTHAKLIRAILEHHYANKPLPRLRANETAHSLIHELNRIGVNLNQLVHLANATRLIPVPELHDLLRRIRESLDRI